MDAKINLIPMLESINEGKRLVIKCSECNAPILILSNDQPPWIEHWTSCPHYVVTLIPSSTVEREPKWVKKVEIDAVAVFDVIEGKIVIMNREDAKKYNLD